MINLNSFKRCPAKLVLEGRNVFDTKVFEELKSLLDFSNPTIDERTGRKSIMTVEVDPDYQAKDESLFEKIKEFFSNKDTLYKLMEQAILGREHSAFLHARKDGDLSRAVEMCKSVNFKFTEDFNGFSLKSHMENLDTIAWSQIYFGPNHRNSGTTFIGLPGEDTPEYQIPFLANSGYFAINSMYTWHKVDVKVNERRTLEIIWLN